MKPKVNKNLSLPWNPQGEKASGNHQILLPREKAASLMPPIYVKLTRSHFLVLLYQLFDPADRAIVTGTSPQSYLYQLSPRCEQKPLIKNQHIY